MKAVFMTGGKQYTACEGDVLYIEKLEAQPEETVTFEEVLLVGEGTSAKFGTPTVAGAKVEGKVIKNGKGKKLNIITYKAKKGSSRRMGHRQPYTKVEITKIVG